MSVSKIEKSKGPNPFVRAYLVAYNVASLAGWGYMVFKTVKHFFVEGGSTADLFEKTGELTILVQTGALLEIAHSLFGFVRSPVSTTAIQVSSRILLTWGVLKLFGDHTEVTQYPAYTSMTLAWGVTEIIRYSFYALGLLGDGMIPSWLTWMRYTTFYLLYPIGAGSEAALLWRSLPFAKSYSSALYYTYFGLLVIYPPGLLQMYTYMIGQRAKVIGGGAKKTN
ncbi:PTPLA-domain-containing protein [Gonapodya prolifera JEL478]|uniref:Very-long-chain (3R)-3-hydroxyacyl-CoA dehydratase n=1 Tax=Gonapodya prolifera (strain JEL478) TaxID=1344416 RepID=A0A139ASU1_GONPJ|nr:PTPLA-domain-containing protein [Gonapodya prolifera JEL478]|eukprot:KXS19800.1 PTPLA-domain-containing protein [Gonapodya prolifera JEL478]